MTGDWPLIHSLASASCWWYGISVTTETPTDAGKGVVQGTTSCRTDQVRAYICGGSLTPPKSNPSGFPSGMFANTGTGDCDRLNGSRSGDTYEHWHRRVTVLFAIRAAVGS